ncbi:MAG: ABC transporter permease [Prevotella sp.]|nr:ABC transporter permease [Prevotella sp.]
MKRALLGKLLRHHINAWQLAGFVLANLCGMAIVLAAVQIYGDAKPLFEGNDSLMRPGHIVLTKRVNTVGTITGEAPAFNQKEINRLRQQPFVNDMAAYTPAMFAVFATVGSQRLGVEFSTEMFFEAVPDKYLDVQSDAWHYDPNSDEVPIIMPRAYLNLYNFGFASSQGLPAVSEKLVGKVGVKLRLTGTRTVKLKTGRVVAFSRRLNTILVPQAFLEDMNQQLSPDRQPQVSRIIVQVDNPADERIARFIKEYHYDTEAADADASRAASLLRVVATVVIAVGLLIAALAFYVLLLSIFLLLQKQTSKIDNLLLIGYKPATVARPFHRLATLLNLAVLVGAIVVMFLLRQWYLPLFEQLTDRYEPASVVPALLVALAIFALTTVLNFVAINRKVRAIWHLHE